MKRIAISIIALLITVSCFAQERTIFPFQGGKEAMTGFFRDSVVVGQNIIHKRATGVVILKFSADLQGNVSQTIIYYADDAILVTPIIEAIKKSNHKWIIPNREKSHDYIISVNIRYNLPDTDDSAIVKAAMENYRNKRPIFSNNQVPLGLATLLPAVTINYDIM
ncbi:hypothetical protein KXD93_08435 [Mucilaginibacter sp. BJC16-A38]|uniref:hypothetical protein n=1 Tax=Mucilaginibacter phenanthrenivorans TaxID=1234842 RepID=UPI0021577406|nr:hypothetical protein [Mucilaginibacter phenanthrenivorans]MCR8557667.1 hypothetical protein [Mucilaginibacter phenanthrenivorans]